MAHIFRRRKRPVGISWRMDETYIKVAGQRKSLFSAVYTGGPSVLSHLYTPQMLRDAFGNLNIEMLDEYET